MVVLDPCATAPVASAARTATTGSSSRRSFIVRFLQGEAPARRVFACRAINGERAPGVTRLERDRAEPLLDRAPSPPERLGGMLDDELVVGEEERRLQLEGELVRILVRIEL